MNPRNIFLLIFLTFHMKTHLAQEIQLSGNPAMFDDQYKGCTHKMDKIIPKVLQSEIKSNDLFRSGWQMSENHWSTIKSNIKNLPQGFRNEHGIALVAYTSNLYQAFNKATRDVGSSIENYRNKFGFKAMHYYLTTAMRMLSKKNKKLVYRGVKNIHFVPSNHSRGIIRFGQFTSASEDIAIAKNFGTDSFFKIQTRLGVEIQRFSKYPHEKEVLIPGYELFKVLSFHRKTHSFKLLSKGRVKSRFNCAYIKGF